MRREKSKLRKRIERALTRGVAHCFGFLVRFLSLKSLRSLADGVAFVVRVLAPSRQRVAMGNMRRVFGDRFSPHEYQALAAQVTRNLCRTMIELLKLPYLSPAQVRDLVDVEGAEHVEAAFAQGHGVILLTAHFGNWELMGARYASGEGWPVTVIARDSEENFTAHLINDARRSHGLEVIEREDLRATFRALRNNRLLGILPDQHAAYGGIIVPFLGRPAATPIGVAILALRTGAAIVPGFSYRQPDDTFRVKIFPALELPLSDDRDQDVREITIMCNDVIGRQIREHPEQWLWLHRRWKVDNLPEAQAVGAAQEETHG